MLQEIYALLLPISPEKPAGDDLEYELLFDEIRQARESDAEDISLGEWSVSAPRIADWNRVRVLSAEALATKSKDIQLACWFTEALCHEEGLSGLQNGIAFLNEFITRFWFQCWPGLEDDGLLLRRSKLLRLDRDLSQLITILPMLRQSNTSLACWRQVLAFEHKISTTPDARDELIQKEGDLTMATFNLRATRFSSIDISQQASLVDALMAAFSELEIRYASLSQDPEGGLFVMTRQTLSNLTDYLQRLTQRAIPPFSEEMTLNQIIEEDDDIPSPELRMFQTPQPMSRELAISQMMAIANYFRRAEPSSPVPFLMERAARWAEMTLTEWLEEMINNQDSIKEINNVLKGQSH